MDEEVDYSADEAESSSPCSEGEDDLAAHTKDSESPPLRDEDPPCKKGAQTLREAEPPRKAEQLSQEELRPPGKAEPPSQEPPSQEESQPPREETSPQAKAKPLVAKLSDGAAVEPASDVEMDGTGFFFDTSVKASGARESGAALASLAPADPAQSAKGREPGASASLERPPAESDGSGNTLGNRGFGCDCWLRPDCGCFDPGQLPTPSQPSKVPRPCKEGARALWRAHGGSPAKAKQAPAHPIYSRARPIETDAPLPKASPLHKARGHLALPVQLTQAVRAERPPKRPPDRPPDVPASAAKAAAVDDKPAPFKAAPASLKRRLQPASQPEPAAERKVVLRPRSATTAVEKPSSSAARSAPPPDENPAAPATALSEKQMGTEVGQAKIVEAGVLPEPAVRGSVAKEARRPSEQSFCAVLPEVELEFTDNDDLFTAFSSAFSEVAGEPQEGKAGAEVQQGEGAVDNGEAVEEPLAALSNDDLFKAFADAFAEVADDGASQSAASASAGASSTSPTGVRHGGACLACDGGTLEWSDFSEGLYEGGWSCNGAAGCDADSFRLGRWRWYCESCSSDLCDACRLALVSPAAQVEAASAAEATQAASAAQATQATRRQGVSTKAATTGVGCGGGRGEVIAAAK